MARSRPPPVLASCCDPMAYSQSPTACGDRALKANTTRRIEYGIVKDSAPVLGRRLDSPESFWSIISRSLLKVLVGGKLADWIMIRVVRWT
ncbi:uncharacterized protein RCC_02249 [Ramularia collo-cygni]|uniref:Uncharacterized protein n=1 Tax=Ramularia collo-cygni TaxID=112498 RepID=A0A2D3UYX4_9PEZI|nr:uncharacterized protein RCC_02249 [Ramularia collo-cygni]CZT16406.1 uncharacterized protein RCC_02249 [Ramularia collo-cygni]